MDIREVFASNLSSRFCAMKKVSRREDLAYTADINRTYISKLEKGVVSYAGLEIIDVLAEVLDVEPAKLLELPAKKKDAR